MENRISVNDMELTVRTWNALKNHGINFLDEIPEDLFLHVHKWKNVGRLTVDELAKVLKEHNHPAARIVPDFSDGLAPDVAIVWLDSEIQVHRFRLRILLEKRRKIEQARNCRGDE